MNLIMNFIYEFHQQSSEQMIFILKNIVMLFGTQHRSISQKENVDQYNGLFIV